MRYFEVEGDSPSSILEQFLIQQNIPAEFVEMEVIDAGSKGFFGIGRRLTKVKIKFNDYEYLKRKIRLYLSDILEKGGFDYHIEIKGVYPECIFNIVSKNSRELTGKSGIVIDSLQYMVDRLLQDESSDIRFIVDVANYRKNVLEPLKQKAVKLANEVKATGKPAKLPPMPTFVRREIHILVKSIPGVSTISFGDGQLKSLTILVDKKNKRKDQNYSSDKRSRYKKPYKPRRRSKEENTGE